MLRKLVLLCFISVGCFASEGQLTRKDVIRVAVEGQWRSFDCDEVEKEASINRLVDGVDNGSLTLFVRKDSEVFKFDPDKALQEMDSADSVTNDNIVQAGAVEHVSGNPLYQRGHEPVMSMHGVIVSMTLERTASSSDKK